MPDALEDRTIAALRVEAASAPLTLTEAAIQERMGARPVANGWARATAGIALGVVVVLALVVAVAAPQLWLGTGDRVPGAAPLIEDAQDCPVTEPTTAPPEIGARLFGSGSAYGNDDLWVGGLAPGGITVVRESDIHAGGSIEWKYGWWRNVDGQLRITGRRIDADAPPLRAGVPEGYGDIGFQASGVTFPSQGCWEVTGTVGGSSMTFVTFVILAPEVPSGTFQATQPFDNTCLEFTVAYAGDREFDTRWWDVGASGDCSTRTSDIAHATAKFPYFPVLLSVGIPLMDGGTHEFSLRLTGIGPDEIRFARAGESEVRFVRVEEVDPTFAPVP